jgi:hypothetical protein
MSEAGLFIGWGLSARGREKAALEVFDESIQYWTRLQQEGQIERFDVAVLAPHGGLGGIIVVRGTAEQIDAVRRSDEYRHLTVRGNLRIDGLEACDAWVDEGLAKVMAEYRKELTNLT